MELDFFTVKDYDAGLRPAQLRDGTLLKHFAYFPGADFCFAGVDAKGVTHAWRGNGRKNGKVNHMAADLVKVLVNPDVDVFFLARTMAGNYYAGNDLQKVKDGMTKANEFNVYRFEINFKKQVLTEWRFLEKVKKIPR